MLAPAEVNPRWGRPGGPASADNPGSRLATASWGGRAREGSAQCRGLRGWSNLNSEEGRGARPNSHVALSMPGPPVLGGGLGVGECLMAVWGLSRTPWGELSLALSPPWHARPGPWTRPGQGTTEGGGDGSAAGWTRLARKGGLRGDDKWTARPGQCAGPAARPGPVRLLALGRTALGGVDPGLGAPADNLGWQAPGHSKGGPRLD
jgi:hypothetical protein